MRLFPRSLRARLITWYIVSLGLVHLVLAMVVYRNVSVRLESNLDERLQTCAASLLDLLPKHRPGEVPDILRETEAALSRGQALYVRVVDANQQLVYESAGLPPRALGSLRGMANPEESRPFTVEAPGHRKWRMIVRDVPVDGHGYVGQVAIPLEQVPEELGWLRLTLGLIVPGVILLTSLGAWWLLNRTLSPLREMIRSAEATRAGDFRQPLRVPPTGDEVQDLAQAYNEMLARLQQSFAQMRLFISDASHELRSPLAVLKGEVEMGLKEPYSDPRCQDILGMCAAEIGRLSRLVDTLLFLSLADAQQVRLNFKQVRVLPIVRDMGDQARILAEVKHLEVKLGPCSEGWVLADEMRLRQLLLNLIDNAVKYTPHGGRITLASRVDNHHVELTVTDTGTGIAADDLPRIFDRFYRADRSRTGDGGFGLGLAICRWIVEAHHGTISMDSAPGQGSTVAVRLPLA